MQEDEIELLRQPFSGLMYVGGIPILFNPENCQFHASIGTQLAPLPNDYYSNIGQQHVSLGACFS